MPETRLSHFRILAKIGEGGMGLVYKAEDEMLRRIVALKVLPPDFVSDADRRRLRARRRRRQRPSPIRPSRQSTRWEKRAAM